MNIKIKKQDRLYADINNLIIILSILYQAVECEKIKHHPLKSNDFIALEGMTIKSIIKLPIYNIEMFKKDELLTELSIQITEYYTISKSLNKTITIFNAGLNTVFSAIFINYYERYVEEIKDFWGTDVNYWTNSWSFAWAVRNAYSHNRLIYFRNINHKGVIWRDIELHPRLQNQKIDNVINFTGSLLLLLEMDECVVQIHALKLKGLYNINELKRKNNTC
jgi:hypothetical protein